MKSPYCLALCLVALTVFPPFATAQGFGRPGFVGPGAIDRNEKKDRDDPFGIPQVRVYMPPGVAFPRTATAPPFPDPRFAGQNGASSPWNNSPFPGTRPPSSGITVPPAEFTPVAPPAIKIDPAPFKVPTHEFTIPKSTYSSSFPSSLLAGGRGGVGILGVVGGGIAAFFRALFGRRKE